MNFGDYFCLTTAQYNALRALGIDEIDTFLDDHAAGTITVPGSGVSYYVFSGINALEWMNLLEDEDIDSDEYAFRQFSYLKSTWQFNGF